MSDIRQVTKLAIVKALSLIGGGDLGFIKEANKGIASTNLSDNLDNANLLSNSFSNSSPAGQTTMSDLISPYYKKIEGGLDGVIERANKYRQSLKGTPEYNFPFLSTNKDDWNKKIDVRNFGGLASLFHDGYTIHPRIFSNNTFSNVLNTKGLNPQTMFISESLTPDYRMTVKEHEGSHSMQYLDPNFSNSNFYLNRLPPLKQESYHEIPAEIAPRLAHIKRTYAQQTGNEVTDPETARSAYDWYRNWAGNKKKRESKYYGIMAGLGPNQDIDFTSGSMSDITDHFNSRVNQARIDLESSNIFNRDSRARKLDALIKKQRELINIRKQFPDPSFNLHKDEDKWIDLYDTPESMKIMPGLVRNNPLRGSSYLS